MAVKKEEEREVAEFASDEHRENYMLGLVRESKGYAQRIAGSDSEEEQARLAESQQQVQAEIDRLVDGAKTGRGRASTR